MSPSIKFSLLALASAAAAVPHYGQHSQFHHKPSGGYVGPSGGWNNPNATVASPAGTGVAPGSGDESTTETTLTQTSKATLTQTLYVTPVPANEEPTSVGAVDVGLSTSPSVCGPATVTVTATNQITVTVPAGGAAPSGVPEAPVEGSAPEYGPAAPVVPSSSVAGETKPTYDAQPTKDAIPSPPTPAPVQPTEDVKPTYEAAPTKEAPVEATPTYEAPASATPTSVIESSAAETSPQSSATPSAEPSYAPGSGAGSGGKRGLAYHNDEHEVALGLSEVGSFGWAYNWQLDAYGDCGVPFYPTLVKDNVTGWSAAIEKYKPKVVFGFNEPDKVAPMTPDAACKLYTSDVAALQAEHPDVTFTAPGVSSDQQDPNAGKGWLSQFFEQCPTAPKVLNIHWYGTAEETVDNGFMGFKKYIELMSETFGDLPFYVTEFAIKDCSGEQSAAFLEKAQAYLDSNPKCLGYSYFIAGLPEAVNYGMKTENALGTKESLNPAGKVYVGA